MQTRLRQEIGKRADLARYRIGLRPREDGLRLSGAPTGNFFFNANELPDRVRLLHQHLPMQAEQIAIEADNLCRHRFRLLGYRDVPYASEIDWHLDAVHGLRAPLIPWFKIDFLDFNQVGDHKITWELNRHQHLVTLAKAWLLTAESKYTDEVFAQWYSWQRANPYPLGANWASSLEVGFRSLSWIWIDQLLANKPDRPVNFVDDLRHALALNGRHMERYLSTYFSPNTHLLGEAVALFFIGTLYPQIPSAERWKRTGWKIILKEASRQVRPDGIYFEQSLYYHVYALDFLLHARCLAFRNDIEVPPEFDVVLCKMLNFLQAMAQAGSPDGFGDDDGGRLFDSARNHSEHMADPLAVGAALFVDSSIRVGGGLTEEAIWLIGERALGAADDSKSCRVESCHFSDGGIYIVASESLAQQMVIDAGPQGTGHAGHGHADALSIRFSFGGRRWLTDPGTGCYICPGGDRNEFRGTRAHNTLTVDGLDQAVPEGPFAWSSLPETRVELYVSAPSFTLFAGSHSGYERLPRPVRHRRFVFHRKSDFWLIRDVAIGNGSDLLETSWHFMPDLIVLDRGGRFVASSGAGELAHLTLWPAADTAWKNNIAEDYVSPAYGEKVEARVLRCSAQADLPAEHAVLMIAGFGDQSEEASGGFQRIEIPNTHVGTPESVYRYEQSANKHFVIFGIGPGNAWSFGPWTSDARFLYFRLKNRRVEQLFVCGGSRVLLQEQSLVSQDNPVDWLEWTKSDDRSQTASSDEAADRSFPAQISASEIVI